MRSAPSLLGILGSRMQNSPYLSQVAFRPGSRIRFIGPGFISPRRGTSTHHSAGSGPLPRRAGPLSEVTPDEIQRIIREVSGQTKPPSGGAPEPGPGAGDTIPPVTDYREALAQTLQSLPAAGFERFCQRLLRESGFQEVTITGRSGDGGIDGIGILQVNALVSFKVSSSARSTQGRSRQATCATSAAQRQAARTRKSSRLGRSRPRRGKRP
jgi:hypothetical protein